MQIFRRAGDNLLNLINDILDLSKVEASQLELERTGFSVKDHLEKVVTEMVAGRAREKGLALVCEIAPNVPADLVGDPARPQVLINLLGNAIKFTEFGEVALRVCAGCGLLRPNRIAVHSLGHRHRHSEREIGPSI